MKEKTAETCSGKENILKSYKRKKKTVKSNYLNLLKQEQATKFDSNNCAVTTPFLQDFFKVNDLLLPISILRIMF